MKNKIILNIVLIIVFFSVKCYSIGKVSDIVDEKVKYKVTERTMQDTNSTKTKINKDDKEIETEVKSGQLENINIDSKIYGKHTKFIKTYIINYFNSRSSSLSKIKKQHYADLLFIDKVLKKNNMPTELKALAVIESAMNFKAQSSAGARGLWQFMPGTGRAMGLRIDKQIDERIDLYKSTQAAVKYLKQINQTFNNDWLLTVAGYNWGPGNITRVLKQTKGNSYWDIKDKLPRETRNHVMAFIATSLFIDENSKVLNLGRHPSVPKVNINSSDSILLNKNNYDIKNDYELCESKDSNILPNELSNIMILRVKEVYHLNAISDQLQFDINTLRRWNPDFDDKILTAKEPIRLFIPFDKFELFISSKVQIIKESHKFFIKN